MSVQDDSRAQHKQLIGRAGQHLLEGGAVQSERFEGPACMFIRRDTVLVPWKGHCGAIYKLHSCQLALHDSNANDHNV